MKKLAAAFCLFCLSFVFAVAAAAAGLGDADGDGRITPADARTVLRIAVRLEAPEESVGDPDVDGDGSVTPADARLVLRRAVALDDRFPAEKEVPPEEVDLSRVEIGAPYALVYDAAADSLLYQKNADGQTAPASLLKLLTALTALEYCSPDYSCAVGDEIDLIAEDSSVCGLEKGWTLTLEELLHGMMLCSGNDAAYCVAANAARSMIDTKDAAEAVRYFVGMMNQTAWELGLSDTAAMSPDGYDAPGQHTTPADLLALTKAALDQPLLRAICSRFSYSFKLPDGKEITWYSTNRYLNPSDRFYDPQVYGMKGGFTDDAGCCLISAWQVEGRDYVVIVMGLDSFNARYHQSSVLMHAVAPDSVTVQPEDPPEEPPEKEDDPPEGPEDTSFPDE